MKDRTKKIIHKYFEYVITKIKLIFLQRRFVYEDVTLKYIFRKNKRSKDLLIVFSSCTRRGIKARYNYMRTLQGISCNELFILDDFAIDQRGSYYLGKDFTFCEEKATLALIEHYRKKIDAKKTICCGSSKGGYAALSFGLQLDGCVIIAGAPQFFLASYLVQSGNRECLAHIIGEETEEKKIELDNKLYELIKRKQLDSKKYHIYLHYSDKEHTYNEHIKDLVETLESSGYSILSDIGDYKNHSDIALYFPDYLINTIGAVLSEECN